jgi:hypothetical protein
MIGVKDRIRVALTMGPLSSTRWHEFCKSRKSLHVHISALRAEGLDITSEKESPTAEVGHPGVRYTMKHVAKEPIKCRCCGQTI